jgi:hypothetical protein
VFYGSDLYRKDNPHSDISNPKETQGVFRPSGRGLLLTACVWDRSSLTRISRAGGLAAGVGDRVRSACGICAAWLIGLPRRAGTALYAKNDAEAGWRGWLVTERYGGLGRQYRDARFALLARDPSLRRDELRGERPGPEPPGPEGPGPGAAASMRPDGPYREDRRGGL